MHRAFAVPMLALALLAGGAQAADTQGAGAQGTGPVLLNTHVVVEGPVVRLGDLFEGLGERGAATVAQAPEPGRQVEVDARWLAAVAKAYNLPWRPRSRFDRVVVERASRVIEARRIEAAMAEALAGRGVAGNVSLVLDNPALRLHLPSDAPATLAVTGLSYNPDTGRFGGHVVAPAEGTALARATVSGRVVTMTEVPVLARRVEPGEVIRRADLEWVSVRADRLGRNAITDAGRLLGKSPRRPIRAGETILSADLREPVVVSKNSLVTIKLETERMTLTALGRALDQGAGGELIRVMNTKSNKVIHAEVIGSGLVRVYPGAPAGPSQEAQR